MTESQKSDLGTGYDDRRQFFGEAQNKLHTLLSEIVEPYKKVIQSVSGRVKDRQSFMRKASKRREDDSGLLKYLKPFGEITDIVAFRIISYFSDDAERIADEVCRHFDVMERVNKGSELADDRFGYQSIHVLLRITPARSALIDWRSLSELTFELQVRTVLQHAWAEIEHDIRYKTDIEVRPQVRRRFAQLAGMLEIADREFVQIREEDARLRSEALELEEAGRADEIAIDGATLRRYLSENEVSVETNRPENFDIAARVLNAGRIKSIGELDTLYRDPGTNQALQFLFQGEPSTPTAFANALLIVSERQFSIDEEPFSESKDHEVFHEWAREQFDRFRNGQHLSRTYMEYGLNR